MGLLDWLTDGSLGNMGTADIGGEPPNTGMPGQPSMTPPPVQQTGADGPPLPPSPTPAATTPTPDPTPAAGPPDPPMPQGTDPMAAGGSPPNGPGLPPPMPGQPPSGAAAPPLPPPTSISPPGTFTAADRFNKFSLPAGGGPLSVGDANKVVNSYESTGGHAFAPPDGAPGAAAPGGAYKLGDQTALGRALGIDPKSSVVNETLGGLGAGLTAAGNSKGKSPFQALTSGAGATLEGANKERHADTKDAQTYLTAAINAKRAGDDATYKTNYTAYLAAKLKSEQAAAASKDATVANKNDSPTQLYLAAQRNVAADPLVKGAMTAYQSALKTGNGPNDPEVQKAKAAYEQTVQERQSAHLAGVGLHPQTAAEVAKQPGMTQANPVNAGKAGITSSNIGKKLQPGQYYTNPADGKVYQYKGSASKSSSATPSVSKPEPADPMKPDKVPASASAEDD
jgi:hypothetical protein